MSGDRPAAAGPSRLVRLAIPIKITTVPPRPASASSPQWSGGGGRIDGEGAAGAAVGDRDAGGRGHGDRAGHSRHHPDLDTAARQARISSPPRPKTNGSPPFSRTTVWPRWARSMMSSWIRSWLVDGGRQLADVDQLGSRSEPREIRRRCQPVVEDHVGVEQGLARLEGEQPVL